MSSFYVENFGCRATQADGAAIAQQLQERGLTPADELLSAEVVVLNTCTVTAAADQDVRASIRRIHRQNPSCRILVTGCYAQRAPQEIAALPGVTAVIGNSHKGQLGEIVCASGYLPPGGLLPTLGRDLPRESASGTQQFFPASNLTGQARPELPAAEIYVGDIFAHTELVGAPVFESGSRTRPNLKVQDGCNNRCSFCIIPAVRGRSRSLRLEETVDEVRALVDAGFREVVISGINLGRWGRDLPGRLRLENLIDAILERTLLEKLRISSVEPMDWSEELIGLMAGSPRIAKHAHLPMQSGSDRVLRQMHRRYRPWHYADRVRRLRQAMPQAAIGADVMVGFPGETDSDFEETRALVEQLPLTYLHVFTYSSRPGTASAAMPLPVAAPAMKERNRILREIGVRKKVEFMRSFVGRTLTTLTLNVHEDGHTEALTDNYLKIRLPGHHAPNQWMRVRVQEVSAEGMVGNIAFLG